MKANKLKRDLRAGKVCIGATVTMNSPAVAELMSRAGFDWLWLETEHSTLSEENVLSLLQATNGADVTRLVRVPWNDKTMIKRFLDTGPDGIIVPLVSNREEAEYAVRAMKYPPLGERGGGLGRAQVYGLQMADYMAAANDEVMLTLMIEHIRAVENIDDILAVPSIDSVMVGSLDLSGSMGLLGQTSHPRVEEAIQKVLAASRRANVPCGIITTSPEQANQRIAQGFTHMIIGIDVLYMVGATTGALGQVQRVG